MTAYPTAQEFAAKYTLLSPNGYRATFNDQADADYVGALLGPEAISGLDSPAVRASVTDRTQDDGAYQGFNFHGSRPITMRPTLNFGTVALRNAASSKLRQVLNDCMTADGTLTWTPTGSIAQFVKVRKNGEYRETGGVVKEGFVALMAANPFIFSSTLHGSGAQANAAVYVAENQGNARGQALLATVTGPGTGLSLANTSSPAQELYLPGLTLAAGTSASFDFEARTVLRSDGVNLYQYVDDPPKNAWIKLRPGNNQLRLLMDSGSTGATTVTWSWRDTWL